MKTLNASLMTVLAFALISGCHKGESPASSEATVTTGSLAKGSGPSATGQGRIAGTDRVFAFNVTTRPNGTVQGEGTLNRTDTGIRIKFRIDCISVSGNVATMSGTVTGSNVFVPGGRCWFRVKDNGEGANAPPDEMTGFIFCEGNDPNPTCSELTCGSDLGLPLNPIEAGNIQVMP